MKTNKLEYRPNGLKHIKDKHNILYVSSIDISHDSGPSINEKEFINDLHKQIGNKIHFMIPKMEKHIAAFNISECTFTVNHRGYSLFWFPIHVLSQILHAHRLLSDGRYNLLIYRLDILPLAQFYITRFFKLKYVIKSPGIGIISALAEKGGLIGKILKPLNTILIKYLVTHASAIDVCTKEYINLYAQMFKIDKNKICWIENACNTDIFYPMDKSEARIRIGYDRFNPVIGIVAGNPWSCGGKQLIEVIPTLIKKYSKLGIIIAGDSRESTLLKERAKELGVMHHCIFAGLVDYNQIPIYINCFDIGISLDTEFNGQIFGNSSLKVRQYIACGIPVISGPGENIFYERPDLGLIIDVNNLDELIAAVYKWLSLSHEEYCKHRKQAAIFAQEHISFRKKTMERLEFWNKML